MKRRIRCGLSEDEYQKLLHTQGGVCAICGRPPKTRRLAVDHNHKTGKVRGLLCWSCNYGLGFYRDRSELLYGAAKYLESFGN